MMGRVNEIVIRLEQLRGEKSLNSLEKSEIESLYDEVLGKKFRRTSCTDCYRDAVIEMYLYLRKNGKMKEKCKYVLKNGALLQIGFGSQKMYTNKNLTDDVAEEYLRANPSHIDLFAAVPDNWKERTQKTAKKNKDESPRVKEEELTAH